MGIRIRKPSREPLTPAAITGFIVAALSVVVATAVGFLISWLLVPGLLKMGLLASFVASAIAGLFTSERRST